MTSWLAIFALEELSMASLARAKFDRKASLRMTMLPGTPDPWSVTVMLLPGVNVQSTLFTEESSPICAEV